MAPAGRTRNRPPEIMPGDITSSNCCFRIVPTTDGSGGSFQHSSTAAVRRRTCRVQTLPGGGGGVAGGRVADLIARPQPVGEVRGREGLAGLFLLRADDHRAVDAGEELDLEQLLHA